MSPQFVRVVAIVAVVALVATTLAVALSVILG